MGGSAGGCPPGEVQDLGRDFNPGPTVKGERPILPATPFLISLCFFFMFFNSCVFLVLLPAGQTVQAVKEQLPAGSAEVHVTQAGLPGESERASERGGEIR